jgi:hypothetical protein
MQITLREKDLKVILTEWALKHFNMEAGEIVFGSSYSEDYVRIHSKEKDESD